MKCQACGWERSWSRQSHAPDCTYMEGLRGSKSRHPSSMPAAVPVVIAPTCPAHPSEGRFDCIACSQIADERKESV